MPSTYDKIAATTLGSAASSYTFSSIAGTYTDLVLVMTTKLTTGADGINMQFNGDTGTNYSFTYLSGNGTSASSGRFANTSNIKVAFNGYPTTADGHNSIVQVNNYSNATTFKTAITRDNNANNGTGAIVGTWRNTNAITSIVLTAVSSTFTAGSTFTLYGIKAA